jgi:hypothetical protein
VSRDPSADADPIESYLDELLGWLRGTPADVRRSLLECESHLRDRADAGIRAGRDPREAASEAVSAFGPARAVARELNGAHRPQAVRTLVTGLTMQGWQLGVVGLLAIGVSGVLAWLLTVPFGTVAVFADAPGTHLDPVSCAHYLSVQPQVSTCVQAALAEGRDDVVVQRIAAGVVGLLLLGVLLWWRRWSTSSVSPELSMGAALVGVVLFGAVGACLTGYGVDRAVVNTGAGQWLAAGAVALIVAAGYLVVLGRSVLATQHP